jgi:hypothetical protein
VTTPPHCDDLSLTNFGAAAVVSAHSDASAHCDCRRSSNAHTKTFAQRTALSIQPQNGDSSKISFSGILDGGRRRRLRSPRPPLSSEVGTGDTMLDTALIDLHAMLGQLKPLPQR